MIQLLLLIFANTAFAADRIGNGGGVWSCETPQAIDNIMFVDFFEARTEFQLEIKEKNIFYFSEYTERKNWIQNNLDFGNEIQKNFNFIEQNINYADAELQLIEDALYRIIPGSSFCPNGKWKYTQLVNFNEYSKVLIRKDLWESPLLSSTSKAGVLIHEGVYSYLREKFNEKDSVRTRIITGLVFSTLSDSDKVQKINEILKGTTPPPPPPPPVTSYYCALQGDLVGAAYIAETKSATVSTSQVQQECAIKEHSSIHCSQNVVCEKITTSEEHFACGVKGGFGNSYSGTGRVQVEAQANVLNECIKKESSPIFCPKLKDIICEQF